MILLSLTTHILAVTVVGEVDIDAVVLSCLLGVSSSTLRITFLLVLNLRQNQSLCSCRYHNQRSLCLLQ
jgi:hypothetical protein